MLLISPRLHGLKSTTSQFTHPSWTDRIEEDERMQRILGDRVGKIKIRAGRGMGKDCFVELIY